MRRLVAALCVCSLLGLVTVAVTAAPVGAVPVSNEDELRTAFATEASVELLNDITLTDCTGGGALERTTTDPVVLDGQGFTLTQTCADAVVVQATVGAGMLTVQNITITGGNNGGSGGGIFSQGDLTVISATIRGNRAGAPGGGIAVNGTVFVQSSAIVDNEGPTGGGGIAGNLVIDVRDSTISNNLGNGVITSEDPTSVVTLVNSTVSGNHGPETGGGVSSAGDITLVYATIANNDATLAFDNLQTGSGAFRSFASVVVGGRGEQGNCIISPQNISLGYNYSDDTSCTFTQPTDRQDQPVGSARLGALADNGGLVPTMLPEAGSPLIDAIPVGACQDDGAGGVTTDERGIARPQAGGCDIGAVEVEQVVPIVLEPTFTG